MLHHTLVQHRTWSWSIAIPYQRYQVPGYLPVQPTYWQKYILRSCQAYLESAAYGVFITITLYLLLRGEASWEQSTLSLNVIAIATTCTYCCPLLPPARTHWFLRRTFFPLYYATRTSITTGTCVPAKKRSIPLHNHDGWWWQVHVVRYIEHNPQLTW